MQVEDIARGARQPHRPRPGLAVAQAQAALAVVGPAKRQHLALAAPGEQKQSNRSHLPRPFASCTESIAGRRRISASMLDVDEESFGARVQHTDTEGPELRVSDVVGGRTRPERLDAGVEEGDVGYGGFSCGQLQPGNRSRDGPFPHGDFDRRTCSRINQLAPQVRASVFGQGQWAPARIEFAITHCSGW